MILAHSPAEVLVAYLIARGLGVSPVGAGAAAWSVGPNKMPNDTAVAAGKRMISVFDRRADQNSVRMPTGDRGEFWGWQVLVRGNDDNLAGVKLRDIAINFDALYKWPITLLNPTSPYIIHRIRRTHQPVFLKQEEQGNMRIWTMEGFASIYYEGS